MPHKVWGYFTRLASRTFDLNLVISNSTNKSQIWPFVLLIETGNFGRTESKEALRHGDNSKTDAVEGPLLPSTASSSHALPLPCAPT